MADEKVKLNVGCGNRKMHGFINIDGREDVLPDRVVDVSYLHEEFKNVDLIYACHVLEHFPLKASTFQPITWKEVLKSWYTTLKTGGTLRLSVPDIEEVCKYYVKTGDLDVLYAFFYGGQKYDFDFHYHCWSFETLERDLKLIGFKDVKRYDWKKTEHFYIDDYSQTYLPHMDKIKGKLLSLNVEAIK